MSPATMSPVLPQAPGNTLTQVMKQLLSPPGLHGTMLSNTGVTPACSSPELEMNPMIPASICRPDRLTWARAQHRLYLRWMDVVNHLGQIKKHFPGALIFRAKPYFLCSLNYILAWHYLFSVTQINISVLIILVRLRAERIQRWWKLLDSQQWKWRPLCPTQKLLEELLHSHAPLICPWLGPGSFSCQPHEQVHVCTVYLQTLPTTVYNLILAPSMLDT